MPQEQPRQNKENADLIVLDGIAHEGILHEVETISSVIRDMLGSAQG